MTHDDDRPNPRSSTCAPHDIAEDKRQELLRLFPEVRTEGGKLDFDRLKLASARPWTSARNATA